MKTRSLFLSRDFIVAWILVGVCAIVASLLPTSARAGVEIAEDGTCLVSGSDAYGAYMPHGYAIDPCHAKRVTMTCVVSGIDAYGYYMKPGYGVRKCIAGSAPTAEMIRRSMCPEMWSTVTNVSRPECRAENDRRNTKH